MGSGYEEANSFEVKVVPVGLDFSVTNDMTIVAMSIYKYLKLSQLSSYHATTKIAIFFPSCQWHNLVLSCLINQCIINCGYNIQ